MLTFTPFQAAHLAAIKLQGAQGYLSDWVTYEQAAALVEHHSSTAITDDGEPVAAAGIIPMWQGRSMVWAFLSDLGPANFMRVHREVKRFLDGCYTQRIEMTVDCDHKEAHRWARMLGFKLEATRMRAYAPDGHDCALYARVL
jgi:hypothetical protein|tara:strand:- start:564 stop:992 length:429 start_codon:yes stop_codon:yes gene_type:complete